MKTYVHLWYPAELLLEWEMLRIKIVQKIKAHFMFNTFFPENPSVYERDNVKKCDRVMQATDNNIMRNIKDAICRRLAKAKNTDTHL